MDFEGELKGKGQGKVSKHLDAPADIFTRPDNKILLRLYPGKKQEDYLITYKDEIIDGGKRRIYYLKNITPTYKLSMLPKTKDKFIHYKTSEHPKEVSEIMSNEKYAIQPKIKGTHVVLQIHGDGKIRVFTPHLTDNKESPLEQTFKIPELLEREVKLDRENILKNKGDKALVRGVAYLTDKEGNSLGKDEVEKLVNMSTPEARDYIRKHRYNWKISMYDLESYNDDNSIKYTPYLHKLDFLKNIQKRLPYIFSIVPTYIKPEEKAYYLSTSPKEVLVKNLKNPKNNYILEN